MLLAACGGTTAGGSSTAPVTPGSAAPPATSAAAKPSTTLAASASAAASIPAQPSGSLSGSGDAVALNLAYSATSAAQSPTWVAEQEGLYARYGLKASVKLINSSPVSTAALLAGEIDALVAGADGVVAARSQGAPLSEIAAFSNYLSGRIAARPGIDRLDQVKKMAVTRLGGNTDFEARQALKRAGIDPSTVNFIQAGSGLVAALVSGQVDAASMGPLEAIDAVHQGNHLLVDDATLKLPFASTILITTQATLQGKPDAIRRLLQALGAAMHVYFTNPAAAQKAIAQYAKLDNAEVVRDSYESALPVMERELTARPEAVAGLLEAIAQNQPDVKNLRPDQLIDDRLLKGLVDSGFFKSLQ
jgi:NitT/TauT family transport system substrate-binding protein